MQDRASPPPAANDLPDHIARVWPPAAWRDTLVAVAVSGGADSVAMLRAMSALKTQSGGRGALTVLHFDHGVRGSASAADARWVPSLAGELGLAAVIGHAEGRASASEEALRDARREFFRQQADALGARYLATGHTADDQAETVLFRILRGSGLRGLRGIPRFSRLTEGCALVRPLLSVGRDTVTSYLETLGQTHRTDETNRDLAYARNWVRRSALPALGERFPQASRQLVRLSEHAEEIDQIVEQAANELLAASLLAPITADQVRLDRGTLAEGLPALVRETLRLAWRAAGGPEQAMDRACWRRLADLTRADQPDGRLAFPGGVHASVAGGEFVLAFDP